MQQFVRKFPHCHVLVVGDIMLDEYLAGDCSRLSPEAPVPILRVQQSRDVLGGAGNTAANLVSLGSRVTLVGLVGSDPAGLQVARRAADLGIDLVALDDGRSTLRKTRVVGQQQQMMRLDYEDTHPLDSATEEMALREVSSRLGAVDVVIISDYAKGLLSEGLCQRIMAEARRRNRCVVVDPRPDHAAFYRHCDYVTPNWRECLGLLGRTERSATPDAIDEAAASLAALLDTNVVLTLGAMGVAFCSRDQQERFHVPTLAREVYDVSGAGDTVVAAFSLARAVGASHADAVALANRAAGIVVGKFGTATLTAHELVQAEAASNGLVERDDLAGLAASLRGIQKRVVTINGSFDLLHAGHLYILTEARKQGDALIVGLNSDASVRRNKGPDRPLVPQVQRAEMLLALRVVDYVHIFDESDPIAFLEVVKPDVHVNGAEYGESCIEAPTVKRHGGRLHLVDRQPGLSTTGLIDLLRTGVRVDRP
jgi:D-beta-D-heptose 7-phosphate kinase / D-beta-D-heptose 1-phosphate adenosyltransferase